MDLDFYSFWSNTVTQAPWKIRHRLSGFLWLHGKLDIDCQVSFGGFVVFGCCWSYNFIKSNWFLNLPVEPKPRRWDSLGPGGKWLHRGGHIRFVGKVLIDGRVLFLHCTCSLTLVFQFRRYVLLHSYNVKGEDN